MGLNFRQQLHDQLLFIKNSAEAVARGNLREAVRIATAIRVIVHQTPSSTSLLTHLGCSEPTMLSTGIPLPETAVFGESGLTRFAVLNNGMVLQPVLDQGQKRLIPLSEWWEERVYVLNASSLTRRTLVLTAANKDGGAHVDEKLPPRYETFLKGLWRTSADGKEQILDSQAMVTLLQIGFEVNHSPGILSLVGAQMPSFLMG